MNLLERLEVIAADYYTKAMAIRTTIQILNEYEKLETPVKKSKRGKRKPPNAKERQAISKRMKAYWAKKRANKNNKRGSKES